MLCPFTAIRTGNWKLRVSSLKQMASLFAAFDRPSYQKIIPQHLADILTYPEKIRQCFECGAFVVSIKNRPGHSVALDECHEMCINKDMNSAIVQPTKPYLQKTLHFFSYRIAAYKNMLAQLFPESEIPSQKPSQLLFDLTNEAKKGRRTFNGCSLKLLAKTYCPSSLIQTVDL